MLALTRCTVRLVRIAQQKGAALWFGNRCAQPIVLISYVWSIMSLADHANGRLMLYGTAQSAIKHDAACKLTAASEEA
jgi:hypothetical protein